jgi:hypothetical protein
LGAVVKIFDLIYTISYEVSTKKFKKCNEDFQRAEEVVKGGLYRLGLIMDKNSAWQHKANHYAHINHSIKFAQHSFGQLNAGL